MIGGVSIKEGSISSSYDELLPLAIQDPLIEILKEHTLTEDTVKALAGQEVSEGLQRGLESLRDHPYEFETVFVSDGQGNVYVNKVSFPGGKGEASSSYAPPLGYRVLIRCHVHPVEIKDRITLTYPYLSLDDFYTLLLPSRLLGDDESAIAVVSRDQITVAVATDKTKKMIADLVARLPERVMSEAGRDKNSLELIAQEFEKARKDRIILNEPQSRLVLNKAICEAMGIVLLEITKGEREINLVE